MDQVVTWAHLVWILVGIACLYAFEIWLVLKRGRQSEEEHGSVELLRRQFEGAQREIQALKSRLDKQESDLQEFFSQPVKTDPQAVNTPYRRAIELARGGTPAAEVAVRCGLSRSEAELIVALYRRTPS